MTETNTKSDLDLLKMRNPSNCMQNNTSCSMFCTIFINLFFRIWRRGATMVSEELTPNILNCVRYRKFYVSWADGYIVVRVSDVIMLTSQLYTMTSCFNVFGCSKVLHWERLLLITRVKRTQCACTLHLSGRIHTRSGLLTDESVSCSAVTSDKTYYICILFMVFCMSFQASAFSSARAVSTTRA